MINRDEAVGLFAIFLTIMWAGIGIAIFGFYGIGWVGLYIAGSMFVFAIQIWFNIRNDIKLSKRYKPTGELKMPLNDNHNNNHNNESE